MYTGRFIIGLSCGINQIIVPIYIKEMSPDAVTHENPEYNLEPYYLPEKGIEEMSGRTGSFHYLFVSIGIFVSSLITALP